KFNGISLLDNSATGNQIVLQIGADSTQTLTLDTTKFDLTAVHTAVDGYDLSTQAGATTALGTIETQINAISAARSYLGANQNRLEHTINNLNIYAENLQASES